MLPGTNEGGGEGKGEKILIVTPKSVSQTWDNEFATLYDQPFSPDFFQRSETPYETKKGQKPKNKYAVKNAFYNPSSFHKASEKGKIDCHNKFLILDESQAAKAKITEGKGTQQKGVQAKSLLQCAHDADNVLLLSAAPLPNSEGDIVNLLSMLATDKEGQNQQAHNARFEKLMAILRNGFFMLVAVSVF